MDFNALTQKEKEEMRPVIEFFSMLAEWDAEDKAKKKESNGTTDKRDTGTVKPQD